MRNLLPKFAHIKTAFLMTASLGAITGCKGLDPLTQAGHWTFTGANEINLQAQVENREDLVHGQSTRDSDGNEAAAAVSRWRQDQVKPLLQSGVADLQASGTSSPASSGSGLSQSGSP